MLNKVKSALGGKKVFSSLVIVSIMMVAGSSWGISFERILYLKGWSFVTAVAAGDVNKDGYGDLVTNIVDGRGNGSSGYPTIFLGPPHDSVPDIILSHGLQVKYVSAAGDVNGDGYSDVLIGGTIPVAPYSYEVHLYLGGMTVDTVPDIIFRDTLLDGSPYGIGDFNGDGYDDIAIPFYSGNKYFVEIYFGGTSMDTTRDLVLRGRLNYFQIEEGGDINGDGYSDVVTIVQDTVNHHDTLLIYYGKSIPNNTVDTSIVVDNISSFSIKCDVKGDGYSDIIVGSAISNNRKGNVYIFFGGKSLSTNPDVTLEGESSDSLFGYIAKTAGDVTGDGFDDILIYGQNKDYLFLGGDTISSQAAWENSRTYGGVLGTAGDINNDGKDEFFTGQYSRTAPTAPPYLEVWQNTTGINEGKGTGSGYKLSTSPNPFRQFTTLEYSLDNQSDVSLSVYDIKGSLVKTLTNNVKMEAGVHKIKWNGEDNNGRKVSNGVYFCKLQAGDKVKRLKVKKILSIGGIK